MVTLNKTTVINGISVVNDGEKDVQILYMTANIPLDGKISINSIIQDKKMFQANKDEVLKDVTAFEEYAYSLIPEEVEREKIK